MKAMSLLFAWRAKNFLNKQVLHMKYGEAATNWKKQTRDNKLYLHFEITIQRELHKRRNSATSLDLEFPELISFTIKVVDNE